MALGQPMTESEIFERSPGLYFDGQYWIVIFHAHPSVTDVSVKFEFDEQALALSDSGKFWYLKAEPAEFPIRAPKAGDKYRLKLSSDGGLSWHETQDPAARMLENTGASAWSIVTESDTYKWQCETWRRPGWEYLVIYELHAKRFTQRNGDAPPLQQVAAELTGAMGNRYLADLNVTALELLPVNAFFSDMGWGYNGVFLYAIEESYGTPDDLKTLVDAAHAAGKAVILDIVYNHIGIPDNPLWDIDRDTYFSGDTDWGAMFDYGNDVARHFLVQNLLYLAREFRIDGFRFDMTHILHEGNQWTRHVRMPGTHSGWLFLRELREKIKREDPNILLVAEELPDNWYVTAQDIGQDWAGDRHAPFDSQWCDTFHDEARAALTGGHLDHVKNAMREFGDSWESATLFVESHDEVGNEDARIAKVARDGKGWEMSQIGAAMTILGRGVPMLFMGQESGEWTQFGKGPGGPNGSHWDQHRLDLSSYEVDHGRTKLRHWYTSLIDLRRAHLWDFAAGDVQVPHVHNENGVVAFTRAGGKYLVALNFSWRSYSDYDVGVHGFYKEIANTSWPVFNLGSPETTRGGDFHHPLGGVPIPAYGAVVLERY